MNKKLIAVLILSLFFTGCASITGSKNQPVSVTTTYGGKQVANANCTLTNDKGQWFVTTPGSVVIQKAYGDVAIACKKALSYCGNCIYKSANEGAVWGNIIAGGIIGYAVDASSGAGFSYPPTMNVELMQVAEENTENTKIPEVTATP